MAPLRGSSATHAPSTSGNCVISQVFFGVFVTRITAPRRILMFGGALSDRPDWAGLSPSPVISTVSPFRRTAVIFLASAASTRADITSPLSGRSAKTSSMASSEIHDAPPQRLVGCLLVGRTQGGVHVQATRVGLVAILRKHQLPHSLS